LEGDELRVGYGMETKFPGRVNSVKENTLSGIGSPGLVGLAQVTTRVSRVKAFSLSGSCRVSRVKVAGLAKLTDLGQLGWVRPLPLNPDRVNFSVFEILYKFKPF
jgi:hypothetical protein